MLGTAWEALGVLFPLALCTERTQGLFQREHEKGKTVQPVWLSG